MKPKTPASCSGRRSPTLPGIAPPQKPTSTKQLSCAALRFTSSAATSTVGGRLFSGMSMMVVTPPAAAALVALAKPSHSVRPGSLTCTWVSTRPGSSTSSSASRNPARPARSAPCGSTAAIVPSRTPTVQPTSPADDGAAQHGSPGRRCRSSLSNPSRCHQLFGGDGFGEPFQQRRRHRPCSGPGPARSPAGCRRRRCRRRAVARRTAGFARTPRPPEYRRQRPRSRPRPGPCRAGSARRASPRR